jgi:ABC-type dipeptide/oligopeptide/nickel transport system permease subunit
VPTARRRRLIRNSSARSGALIVGGLLAFAILGPALSPHGPNDSDFVHGVSLDLSPIGPCALFPLGADRLYRDVLARLSSGARLSLLIASAATLLSAVIGTIIGILSGWFEGAPVRIPWLAIAGAGGALAALSLGRPLAACMALGSGCVVAIARRKGGPLVDIDGALMRLVDVLLAFPFLLLLMAIGAALEHTTVITLLFTLGATGWLGIARLLRARTMQLRSLEYVVASRALGQSTAGILLKHVLPNVVGPLIVAATFLIAQMIVADSILSYLGVGLSPPAATWGRMLLEGQDEYLTAPRLVIAPAAAILLAVWGFNLLGEGLRDALDPRDA